jgi:hypothetical protein
MIPSIAHRPDGAVAVTGRCCCSSGGTAQLIAQYPGGTRGDVVLSFHGTAIHSITISRDQWMAVRDAIDEISSGRRR